MDGLDGSTGTEGTVDAVTSTVETGSILKRAAAAAAAPLYMPASAGERESDSISSCFWKGVGGEGFGGLHGGI